MSNFAKRTIFGSIYALLILFAILGGPMWFGILVTAFGLIAMIEFQSLCQIPAKEPINSIIYIVDIVAVGVLLLSTAFDNIETVTLMIMLFVMLLILRMILTVFDRTERALRTTALSIFSVIYIGLGLFLTTWLLSGPAQGTLLLPYAGAWQYGGEEGRIITLGLFVMLWVNDTGAYLVGSRFGKSKLVPRLSPKKTWEGLWGGMASTLLVAAIFAAFAPELTPLWWGLMAIVCSSMGTIGDLFESLIKRVAGVKDSGHIIPGHGGILDRIDSLLLTGPTVLIMLMLFTYWGLHV